MSVQVARNHAEALVLEKYKVKKLPVPVQEIAEKEGLEIIFQNLGTDISGLLITRDGKSYCCVHSSDRETRQRFTIAHELAHFVLGHQQQQGEHVHVDRGNYISQRGPRASAGVDPKEIEANQFAASLLMPAQLVKQEAAKLGSSLTDAHVTMLAEMFNVSEQAMTIRLETLGLL